jgi:hypothetical protein
MNPNCPKSTDIGFRVEGSTWENIEIGEEMVCKYMEPETVLAINSNAGFE